MGCGEKLPMPQPIPRRLTVRLLFAFTLLVLSGMPAISQAKNSRATDGLFGPVHTVVTTSVTVTKTNDLWLETDRRIVSSISYDENGNDSRIPLGLNSPVTIDTCVSKHNATGQEIEKDCLDHGRPVKMFLEYDASGRVVDESRRDENGRLTSRHAFEFDGQGRRTVFREFDSDNRLKRKLTWSFDDKGNQTEWTESQRKADEMVLFQKNVWTYDDKGNPLTETQWGNPEGTVSKQFFSYEFDEKGNWIKKEGASLPFNSPELQTKRIEIRAITYYPQ